MLLAVIVMVAAFFFFRTYTYYRQLAATLAQTDRDVRFLARQQQEMEKKARILTRVKSFVQHAQAVGLDKQRWETYEVEIKEQVTFPEAREILSQTGNAGSFYFLPVYLRMTKDSPEGKNSPPGTKEGSRDASGEKKGDVSMDLKGTFLVHRP
jgi:hypothetical protein